MEILIICFVVGCFSAWADRKSENSSNRIFFISGLLLLLFFSSGEMPIFWAAIITAFLLGVMYVGNSLTKKIFGITPSASSSWDSSDIPDYWNWDKVYKNKTTYDDEGEITKEKAIEQFRHDSEKTKRAFNEEEKLRAVSEMDKAYIEGFFNDFASAIDTNLTTLEVLGDGRYSLVQQVGSTTRIYTHWPRRRHSTLGFVMWRGEIKEGKTCHIRYGLSNEHNQQYWQTESHDNRSGFTPLLGEAECVWK